MLRDKKLNYTVMLREIRMRMKLTKVPGAISTHRVLMYAISTCLWCRKAKMFLENNSVEYEYIDIDRSSQKDREAIRADILHRSAPFLFPTIIVDDKVLLTNPTETELRKVLEL